MGPRLREDDVVSIFEPPSGVTPVQPIVRRSFCYTLEGGIYSSDANSIN
jgi:hypothetical protein